MFESLFPILWGIYPEAKLLDHTVIVCLIFRRITQSSQWPHHFTFLPTVHTGYNFSTTSLTLTTFCFFHSHPNEYEV